MNNEESKNIMVDRLIAILDEKFGLTGKEIADLFWLTLKRQEYGAGNIVDISSPPEEHFPNSQEIPNSQVSEEETSDEVQISSLDSSYATVKASVYPENQTLSTFSDSTDSNNKTLPLRVPDPPFLREPLKLLRSLKPLMRSIDSVSRVVLDETKSVERTAAEGFLIPVLKPESERWLELALVVDESKSMVIWRSTILEIKNLLESSGLFRNVRTWGLITNEDGEINFRPGIGKLTNKQRFANHRELIDPNGRRLILIVSDCVARIWRNGKLNPILQDWTNKQPVAIIQMLPDSMWLRTGLNRGASVLLASLVPMMPNKELLIKELLLWKDFDLDSGIKVPVLTLEPEVALNWSQMVAGKSHVNASGFVWELQDNKLENNKLENNKLKDNSKCDSQNKPQKSKKPVDAQKRVDGFRKTASPMARKLASLLAAAPVITLPVVRLIQQTLLPKSQQVHVAEVFNGGLLKPLQEIQPETLADTICFDFMDDRIRDMLVDTSPVKDSVDVLDAVSEYVAAELGKSVKDFVALLKAPEKADDKIINEVKAFAQVTAKVLKRLGGDYAAFAEKLEEGYGKSQTDTETPETTNGDRRDSYLTIKTQPFEFETATLIVKNPGSSEIEYEINRSRRVAKSFKEDLGNGVLLEMVEIPGGTFLMGSPENEPQRRENEGPQHKVTVQPFFMGKFPVTQEQYEAIMAENPSQFKGKNKPVECVSWDNAVEFCAKTSRRTGKSYRLPSEAEWEYACRARTTTPFCFGDTITSDLANYDGNYTYGSGSKAQYRKQTTDVGSFRANAFGLYDMHGNVYEWCEDGWHQDYEAAPDDGSAWINIYDDNNYRLLRGGSWFNYPRFCRCASRNDGQRYYKNSNFGFRVVVASPSTYSLLL